MIDANFIRRHLALGQDALRRRDFKQSTRHTIRVLAVAPDSLQALVLFANAKINSGDNAAAKQAVRRPTVRSPGDANVWHFAGRFADRMGLPLIADRDLRRALLIAPGETRASETLLLHQATRQRPNVEDPGFKRWLCMGGSGPLLFVLCARANDVDTRLETARRFLKIGLARYPTDATLNLDMSQVLRRTSRSGAVDSAKRSVLTAPGRAVSYKVLRTLAHNSDRKEEAYFSAYRAIICGDQARRSDIVTSILAFSDDCHLLGKHKTAVKLIDHYLGPERDLDAVEKLNMAMTTHCLVLKDFERAVSSTKPLEAHLRRNFRADYLNCLSMVSYARDDIADYHRLVDPNLTWLTELRSAFTGNDFISFNSALTKEVLTHPSLRLATDGAFGRSYRTAYDGENSLLNSGASALTTLVQLIQSKLGEYLGRLPDDPSHPFLRYKSRPLRVGRLWGLVIYDATDTSRHHHGDSYLTTIYYASLPESLQSGRGAHAGWLEIGRPNIDVGFRETDVRYFKPLVGDLVFLPSHIFHAPLPSTTMEPRISIATDIFAAQAAAP